MRAPTHSRRQLPTLVCTARGGSLPPSRRRAQRLLFQRAALQPSNALHPFKPLCTTGSAAPGQSDAAAAALQAQQAAALAALLPGTAGAGVTGVRPPLLPMPNALPGISPALPAGMLPLAAPGAAAFFAARPGAQLQQPFFMPVPQQMAAAAAAAAGDAAARRPASRPSSRSSSGAAGAKKYCNCKNSRCLKL